MTTETKQAGAATELRQTQQVKLVAQREIKSRLRSKPFVISMSLMILVVWAFALVPTLLSKTGFDIGSLFGGDDPAEQTVAISEDALAAQDSLTALGYNLEIVADTAAATALVESAEVDAAVVAGEATQFKVVAADETPDLVVQALTFQPEVQVLHPETGTSPALFIAVIAIGAIFMFAVVTFGSYVTQGVVEEKSSHIVELLLVVVQPRALLAGKIIGSSLLAFGVLALMAAGVLASLLLGGQGEFLAELAPALGWFLALFVVGYLLYSSLYAAAGSLISRQEDVASVTSPMLIIAMVPYMFSFVGPLIPEATRWLSYIPFVSPSLMPQRILMGDVAWYEPVIALVILLATLCLVVLLSAKIYENSILHTGGRIKVSEALKQ